MRLQYYLRNTKYLNRKLKCNNRLMSINSPNSIYNVQRKPPTLISCFLKYQIDVGFIYFKRQKHKY